MNANIKKEGQNMYEIFALTVLLIVASLGFGFMSFFIKSVNPNAEKDHRNWASLFFAVLVFLMFGFFMLMSMSL